MLPASAVLWHGMKCAIFEKRSTTTKIESMWRGVFESPTMKSIDTSSQIEDSMGRGRYNPVF
ncbi:hypothetical protein Sjap_024705 [Stephania japonica]|uniref:Uncharacterized protein n=1 Tax=Stephania japonica TaxID=461633 RepID=A0AAP0HK40_9MAGN